jgi:hypothetical protein
LKESQYRDGGKKFDDELELSRERLDGDAWKIDDEKKKAKDAKKKARIESNNNFMNNNNSPIIANANSTNSNNNNSSRKPKTPFALTVDKEKKLRAVKKELKDACDKVFEELGDEDLRQAAKSQYVHKVYESKATVETTVDDLNINNYINVREGIHDCYHSLPVNSPIRASFIQSIFVQDTPATTIAAILNIDISSVYKSLRLEIQPLPFFLRELGFPRNRIGDRGPELEDWFVDRCGPTSGRDKRYYAYVMRKDDEEEKKTNFI